MKLYIVGNWRDHAGIKSVYYSKGLSGKGGRGILEKLQLKI